MARISPVPKLQFFDSNGDPLAGGKLYTYAAGTLVPLATYTDSSGITQHTNPVILDSRGEVSLWLGTAFYDFVLHTSSDSLVYTSDNISGLTTFSDLTASNISFSVTNGPSGTVQNAIDGLVYERTSSEISAGVTPTNYYYPPGDARRFGISVDNSGAENLICLRNAILGGAGLIIDLPKGSFNLAPGLNLDCILRGKGRSRTVLVKSANGDHVNYFTNAGLMNLTLDGNGATYTGRGLVIAAGEGQQFCQNVNLADYDGYCIDFTDTTAGSQSFWKSMKIYRHGGVGAGHAVHIEDAAELAAYPRHFDDIESEGTKFITLGGCNSLFVTNSYIGEVEYSVNSSGALFSACRYGSNSSAVTMRGFNHTITGCNVSPVITLASGVGECAITGNSYNNAIPIIDLSGNGGRNIIDTVAIGYSPTFTSGGTTPTLGNGSLTAVYSRHGSATTVTINLTIGSTTNLGTGELRFELPVLPKSVGSGILQHVGQCVCYDSSSNQRTYGHVAITPNVSYATCATATDVVFVNGPFVWATGDWLRFTATYSS